MLELISNFEEDLVAKDLVKTMQELKTAEKAGKMDTVQELAKKCQALSIRKAEIIKARKY